MKTFATPPLIAAYPSRPGMHQVLRALDLLLVATSAQSKHPTNLFERRAKKTREFCDSASKASTPTAKEVSPSLTPCFLADAATFD